MGYNAKKFFSLDTYDFYCQKEEKEADQKIKQNRYIWSFGQSTAAKKEFDLLSTPKLFELRKKLKEGNSENHQIS